MGKQHVRPTQAQQLAAYKKVLAAIDAGHVNPEIMGGHCMYRMKDGTTGRVYNCAVGALLPRRLMEKMQQLGANMGSVEGVAGKLGNDGVARLEKACGMTFENLKTLQVFHDKEVMAIANKRPVKRTLRSYVTGRIRRLERAASR